MDDLPTEYDVIIIGTGMTESVLAAAFSRIGKQVLHLDANEYYGEDWGSFNLEGMQEWMKYQNSKTNVEPLKLNDFVKESEDVVYVVNRTNVRNVKECWFCDVEKEEEEEDKDEKTKDLPKWTKDKVQSEYRKFNIDLCPKLLFSRGLLVELLISSNIARYAEFKSVSRVLTWHDNHLEPVPCSRADVFATKNVSVVQKRMLVKILTSLAEYPDNKEQFHGFEDKTFVEYLKRKKLPENLVHYIQHAIAMVTEDTPCMEGVAACKAFLNSLGRYGNTPFIFPMYGCGELPQCFCRLCAVFGGLYHLKRGIDGLILKDKVCVGVVSGDRRLGAKYVILASSYAPDEYLLPADETAQLLRVVVATEKSILDSEKEHLTLLRFPPAPPCCLPATVIELGPATHTAPPGMYLVHLTAPSTYPLDQVTDSLFGQENSPARLFSMSWQVQQRKPDSSRVPVNVRICTGPDLDLDYDSAINQARTIFEEIFPSEEFLPRAPDPDEIVMDDEVEEEDRADSKDIESKSSKNPSKEDAVENEQKTKEMNEVLKGEELGSVAIETKPMEHEKKEIKESKDGIEKEEERGFVAIETKESDNMA